MCACIPKSVKRHEFCLTLCLSNETVAFHHSLGFLLHCASTRFFPFHMSSSCPPGSNPVLECTCPITHFRKCYLICDSNVHTMGKLHQMQHILWPTTLQCKNHPLSCYTFLDIRVATTLGYRNEEMDKLIHQYDSDPARVMDDMTIPVLEVITKENKRYLNDLFRDVSLYKVHKSSALYSTLGLMRFGVKYPHLFQLFDDDISPSYALDWCDDYNRNEDSDEELDCPDDHKPETVTNEPETSDMYLDSIELEEEDETGDDDDDVVISDASSSLTSSTA